MASKQQATAEITHFELYLPCCSYSTAFIVMHNAVFEWRKKHTAAFVYTFLIALPECIFCALSVAAQFSITYYIWIELQKVDVCNINSSSGLQWIGVAAFVGEMLQDMFETVTMAVWLVKSSSIELDLQGMGSEEPDPLFVRDKIAGMFFIVLPKLAIAIWLTMVGSNFVALSENNTELILNCLAVVFVTKLDEMVHATVSCVIVKKVAKHVKPVISNSDVLAVYDSLISPSLKAGMWVGIVFLILAQLPQC